MSARLNRAHRDGRHQRDARALADVRDLAERKAQRHDAIGEVADVDDATPLRVYQVSR